jgi:pimeloyl-ACP methyl ester carboxylesterase
MSDQTTTLEHYPGVRVSKIPSNDLTYHVLSAGNPKDPLIVCLHGFPEVAYSYRKILVPISEAGYHVVAYDQRGYGQTTGWDTSDYDAVNLDSFWFLNIVKDVVVLVKTLGYSEVACVIGNEFGALIASLCAFIRPDIFKSWVFSYLIP